MDISLINAGLAAGAALAVVPLILHLMMRQTPKHVIFPALRLLRDRQKQSKKRLRVKNWLLLLARMALFMLMALALARPRITTESSVAGDDVDAAIALVFDTSLSMQYTERGNDRLKDAKIRAGEILKKATDRSEIFVINSADPARPASVTPALALKQIEALDFRDANRPLNASVIQGIAAVSASPLPRRDVYVLTDLARSAWDTSSTTVSEAINKANATKDKKVSCYVLRLTPKEVRDVGIVSAEPASQFATQGDRLEIKSVIRSWGPKTTRVAELWIDGQPKEKRPIELAENAEVEVSFLTPATLAAGLHQGDIRLSGGDDNMSFDDKRFFSFVVQPAYRVLIISDLSIDADFVKNVLEPDPRDLREGETQFCKVTRMLANDFSRMPNKSSLREYSAIFLLNVARLTDSDWGALTSYVRDGGGLVVGLGSRVTPESYNDTAAGQLLPARIDKIRTMPQNSVFAKPDGSHSLFNRFRNEYEAALSRVPVYKAWSVQPQTSRPILLYNDGTPALLERPFPGTRTGHVLLWTTSLSRGVSGRGTDPGWNELWNSWSFLVMLETVEYLAGTSTETLNYEAGQDAYLSLDPVRRASNFAVEGPKPEDKQSPSVSPTQEKVPISSPQSIGQWKVTGKAPDGSAINMGFSVNVPESESTVVPLEENELISIFGSKENVHLAEDAKNWGELVNKVRIGREIFPWIMLLILIIVTLENLLANRFHRETATA